MQRKALAIAIKNRCDALRPPVDDIGLGTIGFNYDDLKWNSPVTTAEYVEYSQEDIDKMLEALREIAKTAKPTLSEFAAYSVTPHVSAMQSIIIPWRLATFRGM